MEPDVSRQRSRTRIGCALRCRSTRAGASALARPARCVGESAGQRWAHSFLFSGLSALLLVIAAAHPGLIILPCLALIPFFHGLLLEPDGNHRQTESLRLGFLLGLSYFGVTLADSFAVSPTAAHLKLAGGTALFALFGWAAGQSRRRWGFNPFVLATLWILVELAFIKLGLIGDLLNTEALIGPSAHGPIGTFLYKTTAPFGILTLSFVIVLLNSVFALTLVVLVTLATARGMALPEREETRDLFLTPGLLAPTYQLCSEQRGPPPV